MTKETNQESKEDKKRRRNPIINILKTEWQFLGNRKKIFVFYMFLFVISSVISLMTTFVIGLVFNSIQQMAGDTNILKLIFLISLIIWMKILAWIFYGTGRILEQLTGFRVHRKYTNKKISKILELPVKWHKDNHSGDTIDKINRGRNALDNFASHYTVDLVSIIINILGSLIILFFVDVKIAVFSLALSSFILFGVMSIDKKLKKYFMELNRFSNKLTSSIFDYLSNIITVITLRLKKVVSKEIDTKVNASYGTYKKAVVIDELKWAFANTAITAMAVLALIYKTYTDYTTTGIILIGTLFILYGYLTRVGDSFFQFGRFYGKVTRLNARIEGAYSIDEEFEKLNSKTRNKIQKNWKNIEIKNLDFSYDETSKKSNLENVNFKFKRGEKIALVGESGSGKSTILALLRGLYPPQFGEVEVDGEKIKKGFVKLKQSVTLIPQDPEIFNDTIGHNITMNLPTRKEDLDKVIGLSQFRKVVERLEKGLNTNVLEKGVSLSGGEKQRLALARGLLAAKDSDIVLLDEPTSSVDSLNEMKIHENIFKEFKNKTIISSIHRLHLLDKFDRIYLFDKGKVIAKGSLSELKKNYKFRFLLKKYGLKREMK